MGSRGMARWIRNSPDVEPRDLVCYRDLLDRLVGAANEATAKCLQCELHMRCWDSVPQEGAVGCPRS